MKKWGLSPQTVTIGSNGAMKKNIDTFHFINDGNSPGSNLKTCGFII